MKRMQQQITTTAVMGLMLVTSLVQASDMSAEKQRYPQSGLGVNAIESIAYNGMGCPQGSVGQSFANDRQSLTLIFDQFVASTGVGVPEDEEVKECRIDLTMQTPDSVQITMQTRGYTMLADGMSSDQHQNVLRAKKANLVTSFSEAV